VPGNFKKEELILVYFSLDSFLNILPATNWHARIFNGIQYWNMLNMLILSIIFGISNY